MKTERNIKYNIKKKEDRLKKYDGKHIEGVKSEKGQREYRPKKNERK